MAPTSPMVASWELASRLKARREEVGLDGPAIAKRLGFTRNYWWAVESDKTVLSEDKLREVIELFGFGEAEAAELLQLRALSKQRAWWASYSSDVDEPVQRLFGLEFGAERIRVYEGLVVTGLLQTPDYSRALMESNPDISLVDVDRLIEVRSKRQERLRGPDPLKLTVVLGEAALLQRVGGTKVLRGQLLHLLEMIDELAETLEVRVRPFTAPTGVVATASLVYLIDFASSYLPTAAWQESLAAFGITSDPKDIRFLELSFQGALDTALSRDESRRIIEQQADRLAAAAAAEDDDG